MHASPLPPDPEKHADLKAWLDQVAAGVAARYRSSRSRGFAWSWARLATFACMPLGGYYFLTHGAAWGLAVAVGGLLLFVWAIRRHTTVTEFTLTLRLMQDIIAEAQARIRGGAGIIRSGLEPADMDRWRPLLDRLDADCQGHSLTEQEKDDLDLFGEPLSLFGLINRTSSPAGSALLAHGLCRPLSRVADMQGRQDAVRWLAEHHAARLHLMAAAAGLRGLGAECGRLYETIRDATPLSSGVPARMLRLWGLAGPLSFILSVASYKGWVGASIGWLPLAAVFVVNAVIMQFFRQEVRQRLRPWLELDRVVSRLRYFADVATESLPASGTLGEQRRRLAAALASGGLPALERRIPLLYLGLSGITHTIVDVLCFWDLQVLGLMERCYLTHRGRLLDAVAALGECERFASLACFASEEPDTAWPVFSSEGLRLEITDGRHPLIPHARAVVNSLRLNEPVSTWIISGSNMSGKSTFLRMAGVNVLLAQTGSATTAAAMTLSPLAILTDLRIRDALSRQESYFLAEVRQVRRMVDAARAGRSVFTLIDEPFRGTNSSERVAAASAVVSTLIRTGGLHLVATHDAALACLDEGGRAKSYHFQESFESNRLVFDYRLRDGPAASRNALKVLEGEGYPPELVARARRLLMDDERAGTEPRP